MPYRAYQFWGFGSGFARPFGFSFHTGFGFPRRSEYLRMLEEYKQELERELRTVEEEIAELKGEGAPPGG